jgi:hypothetical protein
MKTSYFTAVLTLTCLLGLGISAHAQDAGGVVVNIPFEFVAGDATLPAGEYRVNRVNTGANQELEIRGYNNGGTFLLAMFSDGVAGRQSKLIFEHVGGEYFLTKVETPEGVNSLGRSRTMLAVAQANSQGTPSSSGTN